MIFLCHISCILYLIVCLLCLDVQLVFMNWRDHWITSFCPTCPLFPQNLASEFIPLMPAVGTRHLQAFLESTCCSASASVTAAATLCKAYEAVLVTHGWGGKPFWPLELCRYPYTGRSTFDHPCLLLGKLLIRYVSCLLFAKGFLFLIGLVFVSLSLHRMSVNKICVKYMNVCLIVYSSIHYHKYIARTFHLQGSVLGTERWLTCTSCSQMITVLRWKKVNKQLKYGVHSTTDKAVINSNGNVEF